MAQVSNIFALTGKPFLTKGADVNPVELGNMFANTGVNTRLNNQKIAANDAALQQAAQEKQMNDLKIKGEQVKSILREGLLAGEGTLEYELSKELSKRLDANPTAASAMGIDIDNPDSIFDQPGGLDAFRNQLKNAGLDSRDVNISQNLGGGAKATFPLDKRSEVTEKLNERRLKDLDKAVSDIEAVDTVVTQMDQLLAKAFPEGLSESGTEAKFLQNPSQQISAFFGKNEGVRRLNEISDSAASLLAKGIFREAGMLTNQDIARAKRAMPNTSDSGYLYASKKQFFNALTKVARVNRDRMEKALLNNQEFNVEKDGVSISDFMDPTELKAIEQSAISGNFNNTGDFSFEDLEKETGVKITIIEE